MSPTAALTSNALEDAPQSRHCYEVAAGGDTYQIEAIDAYAAERKGRAMHHEAHGFFPTHVSARMVSRARLIERVSDIIVIHPLMVVGVPASEMADGMALAD